MSAFASCLGFTLPEEGGFSDTPGDPGGPTEEGITLASWRAYVASPWVQVAELRSISAAAVTAFYGAMYWNPIMGDALPLGVDLMVFDQAVNAGVAASSKILQRALSVAADGHVGPVTVAAANRSSPAQLIVALATSQESFYRSLPGFTQFGAAWMARLRRRQAAALLLSGANRT